jgi:hypothetical protein
MTEEKFFELKSFMDKIENMEMRLHIIDSLLKYNNLDMKITGMSDCKFKISRFLYIGGDDLIKSVLETERKNVQDDLSVLKEEFEKK